MKRYVVSSFLGILSSLLLPLVLSAEPLRIGYIGSLTGEAAIIGSEISKSLEVIVARVNASGGIHGQQIELVVEDDGYDVSRSLRAYEKLKGSINSHVIFMTTYGALFALGKRPAQDNIVIVDTLDCNDDIVKVSPMHTCVATRTESIGEGILKSIERHGGGATGVLYEEEAWFNFIANTLRHGSKTPLVEITAPAHANDYKGEMLKLKAKGVKQIVFLGNDSMGRAMAEARRIGVTAQFYSIAGVMSPGYQALAGKALEGTVVSNWVVPENSQYASFSKEFEALHHQPVQLGSFAGPTADAATLVFNALGDLQHDQLNAQSLRATLSQRAEFQGISGAIKMDGDGAVRSILETTFTFKNGELVAEIVPE